MSDEHDPMGDIKDDISDGPDFGDLEKHDDGTPGAANLPGSSKDESSPAQNSSQQFEGGEEAAKEPQESSATRRREMSGVQSSKKKFKDVEEVTFPSLDEALNMKFDLNNVTNMQQRLRNINSQPREIK